jgi:hypothetical protein
MFDVSNSGYFMQSQAAEARYELDLSTISTDMIDVEKHLHIAESSRRRLCSHLCVLFRAGAMQSHGVSFES